VFFLVRLLVCQLVTHSDGLQGEIGAETVDLHAHELLMELVRLGGHGAVDPDHDDLAVSVHGVDDLLRQVLDLDVAPISSRDHFLDGQAWNIGIIVFKVDGAHLVKLGVRDTLHLGKCPLVEGRDHAVLVHVGSLDRFKDLTNCVFHVVFVKDLLVLGAFYLDVEEGSFVGSTNDFLEGGEDEIGFNFPVCGKRCLEDVVGRRMEVIFVGVDAEVDLATVTTVRHNEFFV